MDEGVQVAINGEERSKYALPYTMYGLQNNSCTRTL